MTKQEGLVKIQVYNLLCTGKHYMYTISGRHLKERHLMADIHEGTSLQVQGTTEKLMTEGPILRQLIAFMIPVMISQLLQQFYLMGDGIVIGRFIGSDALAAQGTTSLLLSVIGNFFIGMSAGTSIVIGHLFGHRSFPELKKAICTSITFCIISGVILTAAGLAGTGLFLEWLHTPAGISPLAEKYLKISFYGLTFMLVYNVASAILRALGNSRTPLLILCTTAGINLVLDLIFICSFSMGIEGAAWATLISQAASAFFTTAKLMTIDKAYRFDRLMIDRKNLRDCISKALPSGLQAVFMSISSLILQTYINSFGPAAMAGMNCYAKIEGFLYYPLFAFGLAVTTFVSQNDGAGKSDRVKQCLNLSVRLVTIGSILAILLLLPVSRHLIWIFTDDENVISNGMEAILWTFPLYFLYAVNQVYIGVIRGVGNVRYPMITSLISYCMFRVIWCALLIPHFHTMRVVYTSYDISWVIMLILLMACVRKTAGKK